MTTYIEYGVKLSDGQKSKLLSAIQKRSAITLRLKHSHLRGPDELMLTQRQLAKIKKSLVNGTGSDLKISQTQIKSLVKHGGNLFTSLARIGAKLFPLAVKGVSKVAPALATGALSSVGDKIMKKIMGEGISIPKKFFPFLPPFSNEFTQAQIDQINKIFKTGGRLVIKPTRQQIEGGLLGTLAAIGIPAAISFASELFGSGLQVDRGSTSNTRSVYVPPTQGEGYYPPPFNGSWENPIGMGVKKKAKKTPKGKGLLLGKNSPFNSIPIIGDIF